MGFKKGDNIGSKNYFWKGGKFTEKRGYVSIWIPNHPNANVHGYVREHRLVMEEHLGRLLEKREVVHHKDGNRSNNNISNLILYSSNKDHILKNEDHSQLKSYHNRTCVRCNRNHNELLNKLKYGVRWNKTENGWLCSSCRASIITISKRIKNKQHSGYSS